MGVYKYNATDDELNPIAGATTFADCAIGSIIPFGGNTIPKSFLLCDGAEVSKTEYADLYAVIGDAFGTATEATNFRLPDLRECAPVGAGKNITQSIGSHDRFNLGQFKDDQFQGHQHYDNKAGSMDATSTSAQQIKNVNPFGRSVEISSDMASTYVSDTVNGTPRVGNVTRGKRLGVNFIIKAKHSAYPADLKQAVEEVMEDYQEKDLTTPITIGGTSQTTVEGALGGLNSAKLNEKRDRYIVDTRAELDIVLEAIYTSLSNNTQIITQIADNTGVIWGGGSHCVIVSKVDSNWGTALFFGYNRNGESFIIPRISGAWGNIVTNIRDSDVTSTVTSGSTAPITSGGMYDAMYANQQYGKMNIYALGKINLVQNATYTYTIPKYCSFLITTAGLIGTENSVMAGILYGAPSFIINTIVGVHTATLNIEGGVDSNDKGYIKFTNTTTPTRSVNVIILTTWSN